MNILKNIAFLFLIIFLSVLAAGTIQHHKQVAADWERFSNKHEVTR